MSCLFLHKLVKFLPANLTSSTVWQRITMAEILDDEWFKKDYKPPVFEESGETNLDDVEAVFKDSEVRWRFFKYGFDIWFYFSSGTLYHKGFCLYIFTGAPCDRKERRAANIHECIWVDFHV